MVDPDIEALYTVTPEAFVATRDALTKRLRLENRKEDAAFVAKLRRPATAVWVLNQVARENPATIQALRDAGAAAQAAQEALLTGGPPSALHKAVDSRKALITELVATATARGRSSGQSVDNASSQLRVAFEVASVHEEIGALLTTGRLEVLPTIKDLAAMGGPLPGTPRPTLTLVPPLKADPPSAGTIDDAPRVEEDPAVVAVRAKELQEATERLLTAQERLEQAEKFAATARREADEANRAVREREESRRHLQRELDELNEQLIEFEERLEEANLQAREAQEERRAALSELDSATVNAERLRSSFGRAN